MVPIILIFSTYTLIGILVYFDPAFWDQPIIEE